MPEHENLNTQDYNYFLPDDRIAKYPLDKRDESKLLIYNNGKISETIFKNIDTLISPNDLLVFNNTKVINARFSFYKSTGAKIEIFCLEPLESGDYEKVLASKSTCVWKCLVGNSKKWKDNILEKKISFGDTDFTVRVLKKGKIDDYFIIEFTWNNEEVAFIDILKKYGSIPIPPYLNRNSEPKDALTYQTVYGMHHGSVAAPTAGLHFTDELLHKIKQHKTKSVNITLHVGAGTFQPLKSDRVHNHEMHTEHLSISTSVIEEIINSLGNITVVGTTSVRSLESLYCAAIQLFNNKIPNDNRFFISQWEAYENKDNYNVREVLSFLLDWLIKNKYDSIQCATQIIIVPGYSFKLTNNLITNFHQPKSTLLLLIAAFIGEDWRKIYDYALSNNYRFLSYGDSMFLRGV